MNRRTRILIIAALLLAGVGTTVVVTRSIAQTPPTPGSAIYRYDSLGRIVQDIYPVNSAAYSYDPAGNRTTFTQN